MILRIIMVVVLAAALATDAAAQASAGDVVFPENNGKVLAGVRAFDAQVAIAAWLNLTRNRETTLGNAQAAFELVLRRDGAVVDEASPNYLFCEISLAQTGGIVFYHWAVQYYEYREDGPQHLLWTTAGIATIGEFNFEDAAPARNCADAFANEWLKWNPKR